MCVVKWIFCFTIDMRAAFCVCFFKEKKKIYCNFRSFPSTEKKRSSKAKSNGPNQMTLWDNHCWSLITYFFPSSSSLPLTIDIFHWKYTHSHITCAYCEWKMNDTDYSTPAFLSKFTSCFHFFFFFSFLFIPDPHDSIFDRIKFINSQLYENIERLRKLSQRWENEENFYLNNFIPRISIPKQSDRKELR